jgi:hypothetical protein
MTETCPEMISAIDTAVKVGLGALLSALGAITIAVINNSRNYAMERLKRRRDLLEVAVQELQVFTSAALSYWAEFSGFLEIRGNEEKEEEGLSNLKTKRSYLNEASSSFTVAQAKLLLLGDKKANDLIRKYGGVVEDFVKEANINDQALDQEKLNQFRTAIKEARANAINRMAGLYNDVKVGGK